MNWWERICFSGTAVEGSGGDPPPPSPPPPAPSRQAVTPPPPPRRQEPDDDDPPPQPQHRRTPNDQIADLRAEAAQYRISLRRVEAERDDLQQQMTTLQGQIEAATTTAVQPLQQKLVKAQERAVNLAIRAEMMQLGLQDEDLLHLHTKMPDAPKVEVNDDFEVTGAKELAAAFKKWKPDYFKAASSETPPARGNGRQPAPRPVQTSQGNEPPPVEGDGPAIDLRDKTKYPPGSAAYKEAYRKVMGTIPRR